MAPRLAGLADELGAVVAAAGVRVAHVRAYEAGATTSTAAGPDGPPAPGRRPTGGAR